VTFYWDFFDNLRHETGNDFFNSSQIDSSPPPFDLSCSGSQLENAPAVIKDIFENDEIANARSVMWFVKACSEMKKMLSRLIEQMIILLQGGTENDRMEVVKTIGKMVHYGYPVDEKITAPVIQAIATLGKDSASNLVPAFCTIFIGDTEDLGYDFKPKCLVIIVCDLSI